MTDPLAKQRRGCFFYGCLASSALVVAMLTMAFLGLWYIKRALNEFTDAGPIPAPVAQVSAAQGEEVRQRFEALGQAVRDHRPVVPLVVSAEDLNALIATDPRLEALRGKLYLIIEGGRVKGLVSVPLSEVGLKIFAGRYLNGIATFGFSVNKGVLGVRVEDFQVRGKSLPKLLLNRIRKQDLAQRLKPDPHAASALDRLQDLGVRDGKLVIVPMPD